MAHKAPRTKAHAVKFTDADWAWIEEHAALNNMTAPAFVNYVVGDWFTKAIAGYGEDDRWEGLLKQGRPYKNEDTPQSKGDS